MSKETLYTAIIEDTFARLLKQENHENQKKIRVSTISGPIHLMMTMITKQKFKENTKNSNTILAKFLQ